MHLLRRRRKISNKAHWRPFVRKRHAKNWSCIAKKSRSYGLTKSTVCMLILIIKTKLYQKWNICESFNIIYILKFRIIWRKRQKKTKKNMWLKINPKHWVNILPVKHLMVYLPGTSPPAYFQVVGILNESIRLAKHFFHFLFHFFFFFFTKWMSTFQHNKT